MKKPKLQTVLTLILFLISIGAIVTGLSLSFTGVSILGFAVDYGREIGGVSMTYTNCTMGEWCNPTNITYSNPEIHSETDYLIRMNYYTTILSVGYQILWVACFQIIAGAVTGVLSLMIYNNRVDVSEVDK